MIINKPTCAIITSIMTININQYIAYQKQNIKPEISICYKSHLFSITCLHIAFMGLFNVFLNTNTVNRVVSLCRTFEILNVDKFIMNKMVEDSF